MKGEYPYTQEELESLYGAAAKFRTEEPLKGYRQWVLDDLIEKAKRNGLYDLR